MEVTGEAARNTDAMKQAARFDVICLGCSAVDYLGVVPAMPECDTKMEMLEFSVQGGGPAATAAVTAARLGARTAFVGMVGDDDFGDFTLRELSRERVDVSGVMRVAGARSQFAFILVERDSGRRTIIWTRSGLPPMDPAALDRGMFTSCKVLHVDRHEIEAASAAAGWVRETGGIVSMDAGTYAPEVERLLPLVDVLIGSYAFARDATGETDPAKCAAALLRNRAIAGVTCGEDGAYFATRHEQFHVPAFRVETADTTGAGDVFHGAFAFGLARGWDARRCAVFASATAAIKCRKLGGRAGIPAPEQVEELVARTQVQS